MRAADTREGMVVDMTYVAAEYGDVMARDLAAYEYAAVEADAEPAPESTDAPGIPAVLIFTDQGNYGLPADYDIPFINYDGAPDDSEED